MPTPVLLAVLATTLSLAGGCARNAYVRPTPPPAAVANPRPDVVAPGTLIAAEVHEPLSTSTSRPGDRFTIELLDPVVDGAGHEVLGRGTTLAGAVKATSTSNHAGQSADLQLQVLGVEAPGEGLVPVPMEIAASPVELQSSVKREILSSVLGAAVGAGVGVAIDRNKAGLVVGTTFIGLGAGALLAYVLGTRDATIPSGSLVTLRVTRPMALSQPVAAFPECPVLPARAASGEPVTVHPGHTDGVSTAAAQRPP